MSLYHDDFDKNGSIDPILCTEEEGKEYPFWSKDDIQSQLAVSVYGTGCCFAHVSRRPTVLLNNNSSGRLVCAYGVFFPMHFIGMACIRDYIHVMDLAHAHILSLKFLWAKKNESNCEIFNLGTGKLITSYFYRIKNE